MIEEILSLPDGPDKTARIAAWIESCFRDPTRVPILVGGAAVEIVTGGAYTIGDLDFVGSVDPTVSSEFERAGFRRHGRHWIHEDAQVSSSSQVSPLVRPRDQSGSRPER